MTQLIHLDGNSLTLEEVIAVARHGAQCELMNKPKKLLSHPVKSLMTFSVRGKTSRLWCNHSACLLCTSASLQKILFNCKKTYLNSLICFGDPLPEDAVRAIMLIRINSLLKGYSGYLSVNRWKTAELLNKGVTPYIPERLSQTSTTCSYGFTNVGSWTYAPTTKENFSVVKKPLDRAGIEKIQLAAKEGLALINGTTVLTGIGALATMMVSTAQILWYRWCLPHGSSQWNWPVHSKKTFIPSAHKVDNWQPLVTSVTLEGSKNTTVATQQRVQDPYSLYPQIHGASKDSIAYVKEKLKRNQLSQITQSLPKKDTSFRR